MKYEIILNQDGYTNLNKLGHNFKEVDNMEFYKCFLTEEQLNKFLEFNGCYLEEKNFPCGNLKADEYNFGRWVKYE